MFIKTAFVVLLLVISSQANTISFSSAGAYVGRCFVDIVDDLGPLTLATGNIYAGQTRDLSLPDGIQSMKIRCENQQLVGKWAEVFSQTTNGARSLCYTLTGTTFHPGYSARAC